ncbi:MAG: CIA30 family protein [Spirochaetia bacterium]|nr:CIA30 family protein [Spirochaetia bacterium]
MKDGFWYTYDDNQAGGDSGVTPAPDKPFTMSTPGLLGSGECPRMTGTVTAKFPFGFIGMGYYLSPKEVKKSFDISGMHGLRFWHKGDGKKYRVKLVSTHPDFKEKDSDNHFGNDFRTTDEWGQTEIFYANLFQQPGWGSKVELKKALTAVKEIRFVTLSQPLETVDLRIDRLELF